MKTGDEPTRAIEDLLCNLLEEGRAAAPEVTGTHRFAHSRYYYTAWRTAFRSAGIVGGLTMFFFLFTKTQSSGDTKKIYCSMRLWCSMSYAASHDVRGLNRV
ncbi:hypothetical protein BRADI_1g73006v3 [Brachypodium distachyon]|uniref:Uncharacterized protein n=1 Tax=Brachypodium distachyon TaxID=15368 RepID=A0A2K2DUV8_BRADI|nr:hypothetical protein BRADI_1g73006v3 [Brachypodium distachyon]